MLHAAWLILFLASTGGAQSQQFLPSQSPPSAPASLSLQMLAAHNAVRAALKIAPLVWSDRLAAVARDWAGTLLARNQFAHRPNSPYGENLFDIAGSTASPAQVVADWASEAKDYDYAANRCAAVCGHYTQLVWSGTRSVGCAVATGGGREVWVCNYDPPGNFVGKRPY